MCECHQFVCCVVYTLFCVFCSPSKVAAAKSETSARNIRIAESPLILIRGDELSGLGSEVQTA